MRTPKSLASRPHRFGKVPAWLLIAGVLAPASWAAPGDPAARPAEPAKDAVPSSVEKTGGSAGSAEKTEAAPAEAPQGEVAKTESAPTEEAKTAPGEKKATLASWEDDLAKYKNWIDFSVGGTIVNGDQAAFQSRQNINSGAFGGIEDFHWEQKVGKDSFFEMDGRGIFDNNDYRLRLELVKPKLGYVRGGLKEFRTWYDGSGGFFPPTGAWFSLYDDDLALDRGEAFIEGGLTLPDRPTVSFKYTHQYRDGQKDSTSWADSAQLPGPYGIRSIVPTFWDIDERRDIIEANVKHKWGKTDLGLGLRYEWYTQNNSLNLHRRPGEASDRYVTEKEGVQSDMFSLHAFSETRLNEKIMFSLGYSFTTLESDLSGSRIYGPNYDPVYDPNFARREYFDLGFFDLNGDSQLNQHVFNLNFMVTPWQYFSIIPSLRVEGLDVDGQSAFMGTEVVAPSRDTMATPYLAANNRSLVSVNERLEMRYSGVTNWVYYARGDWGQDDGDLQETQTDQANGSQVLFRNTEDYRLTQKYTVGVNWYPLRRLNTDLQYYYKIRDNTYDHVADSTPNDSTSFNRYPAYIRALSFNVNDVNFRVTWRPLNNLTLVTRYDFQLATVGQEGDQLGAVQTSEMTTHILAESITWVPWSRLYLQAGVNVVYDQTDTPAQDITYAITTSKNNYWNANFTAGFVLDNKTDLQAHYFYYRANDFVDHSSAGVPYGADIEENAVTVSLVRRLSERVRLSLKYGYFVSNDYASGGYNSYDGHLIYSGLHYRF